MTTTPIEFEATLLDGVSLFPYPVRVDLDEVRATVTRGDWSDTYDCSGMRVSPRVFSAPRFVTLPNGWQLLCADGPELEHLPAASKTEGPVAWLERRISVAVVAVALTIAGVAVGYLFGLPRLAAAVATRISPEREREFGERTLSMFDDRMASPTDLDVETLATVRSGFRELTKTLPPGTARLEIRDAPGIGPNAFALPGGVVLITDQLIETCTPAESVTILAHELGHVQHRHALRHLLQEFGVSAFGMAISGDVSSLSLSASTLPLLLAQAQYSQGFEEEADAAGFALAREAGFSPVLFGSCLEKIGKKAGIGDLGVLSYASSHPPDAERIARAQAAARGFVPKAAPSD